MKSIYSVINEQAVSGYLQIFRVSMWPNGVLGESSPVRSQEEQLATRVEVEKRCLDCVPGM